jgi:glycerol-3-phosphate dehydrogenase (NAD+)
LATNKDLIRPDLLICNTAKGLYLKDNCLLSEAIMKALGREQPFAVLSGPSFAKEMMMNYPTAGEDYLSPSTKITYFLPFASFFPLYIVVVVASKFLFHAVKIQRLLSTVHFRCYTTQDVIGKKRKVIIYTLHCIV